MRKRCIKYDNFLSKMYSMNQSLIHADFRRKEEDLNIVRKLCD